MLFEIVPYNASLEFYLQCVIFVLLSYGVLTDIRTREVSNKVIMGLIVFSVPLMAWNLPNVGFFNFAYLGVFVMAYFRGLGGADLKAIFPLLFIFSDVGMLAGLLAVFGGLQFLIEHRRNMAIPIRELTVPYFIPIMLSFVVMVIL